MEYHLPVLLKEAIELLDIQKEGCYVDATYGGGGHSRAILEELEPKGLLIAFDQDPEAMENKLPDPRLKLVHANFRHLKKFLRLEGIKEVNGILADLGVSSHQFDEAERGFSYRFEAGLDMRMNARQELTAAQVLNTYDAEELQKILGEYGEVRNARTLAQHIVQSREAKPLKTTGDLLAIAEPLARGNKLRYMSQVFQALRIEVNDELGALQDFLTESMEVLSPGGRIVIISYHSLEDRMVKNFLKSGNTEGEIEKDFYGNINRPFSIITKKPIEPSPKEIAQNPRARSARLRAGEKI